jgi:hypothetical protein
VNLGVAIAVGCATSPGDIGGIVRQYAWSADAESAKVTSFATRHAPPKFSIQSAASLGLFRTVLMLLSRFWIMRTLGNTPMNRP